MDIASLYELYLKHPFICTDSRNIIEGSIFFALKGSNFDGNKYAEEALSKGAAYSVTDNTEYSVSSGCILVDDVLTSLQALARLHRIQLNIPVIAITGSNGKTTTKELCRDILKKKFKVVATKGNLNNHIGVPLTILSAPMDTELLFIEMGANHQGEIDTLCRIAEPDFGAITNVGKAHLEGFGGEEGVKKGKSELYRYLTEKRGTIFINTDDKVLNALVPSGTSCVRYSAAELMNDINQTPFINFSIKGLSKRCYTHLVGLYNIPNIALGIAMGQYFGVRNDDIIEALESYIPENNRSQLIERDGNTFILDAYNANPTSMAASIESFRSSEFNSKVLVLGDMLELGDVSLQEHDSIINLVDKSVWTDVIFIGPFFNAAKKSDKYHFFADIEAARQYFKSTGYNQSAILLKGSRGMALEKLLS